ncbi:MAG: hypothetical protein ACRDK3_01700, partial [Actinomycetota bacterium]
PKLLDEDAAVALLTSVPEANVPSDQARAFVEKSLRGLPALQSVLDQRADDLAAELLASHRRIRAAAGAARRGLDVSAQKPADILGVYLYLPQPRVAT